MIEKTNQMVFNPQGSLKSSASHALETHAKTLLKDEKRNIASIVKAYRTLKEMVETGNEDGKAAFTLLDASEYKNGVTCVCCGFKKLGKVVWTIHGPMGSECAKVDHVFPCDKFRGDSS